MVQEDRDRNRRTIAKLATAITATASIEGSGAGTTALGSTGGAMLRVVVIMFETPPMISPP